MVPHLCKESRGVVFIMTRKQFYQTRQWKDKRQEIFIRDKGICQKCKKLIRKRFVVDHIIPLTDENFMDIDISLNNDNLRLLCLECHNWRTFSKGKIIQEVNWEERQRKIEFWKE